jgi:asparagine synthase (glutamine-hydrolysing)
MCGLVAIFSYVSGARLVDRDELRSIRDAMTARGPDGKGLWMSPNGRVGLAHRRLALLDLSQAGEQPMANADGSLRIVFNGEIYNYRSLRRELEKKGFMFRSGTDTEVLLQLYAEKGERMLDRLRGMFAFVIWDERRGRLFAARDPLGIKPLYYADDGKTLRIASQVKALLGGGGIDGPHDPAGEVGFLLFGYVPEPFTLYRSIKALPAGSFMMAERQGRLSISSHCKVENEIEAAETHCNGRSSIGSRTTLRRAVADSVHSHLTADVSVGVFLSAGLDSAVLTALASERQGKQLKTITLGFAEYSNSENDETRLSPEIARLYGTEHQIRWVAQCEFQDDFDRIVAAMDQPSIDGINTYFVAKAAREAGLKAALSGIGGDELFSGYPSFRDVPRLTGALGNRDFGWLGQMVRTVSDPILRRFTSPKYAGLLEYGGSWGGAYLLRRALFMPWEIAKALEPEVAREGWERLDIASRLENTAANIRCGRLKVSAFEIIWYMRNQLLRDSDWAGMAHSVEIRTPLADIELLRSVAVLVARGELSSNKQDLACLPSKPLPEGIAHRPKSGFMTPVSDWVSEQKVAPKERGLRGWAIQLARRNGFELRDN